RAASHQAAALRHRRRLLRGRDPPRRRGQRPGPHHRRGARGRTPLPRAPEQTLMALFRPDRTRRGPDRFLKLKMMIFAVGAAVAFAGIAYDRRPLLLLAIAILAVGVLLRLIPSGEE